VAEGQVKVAPTLRHCGGQPSKESGLLPASLRASVMALDAGSYPYPSAIAAESTSKRRKPPRLQPASRTRFPARSVSIVSSIACQMKPCSSCTGFVLGRATPVGGTHAETYAHVSGALPPSSGGPGRSGKLWDTHPPGLRPSRTRLLAVTKPRLHPSIDARPSEALEPRGTWPLASRAWTPTTKRGIPGIPIHRTNFLTDAEG